MEMDDMPRAPQAAFECWLNDAILQGVQEPHAMTLSTVDADGIPDARVLILKNVDHRGWHFAIKVASPKGRQLAANPQAALTFYWPALGRQIRLRGTATALPTDECAEDFATRPLGSRISAMASLQSEVLAAPGDLSRRLQEARTFLDNHPQHTEPGWRLFALMPTVVEFWQGTTDRSHQRLRYARTEKEGNWQKQMLWP